MSRTRHHCEQKNRHNGEDLWSRRLGRMLAYCTYNKLLTRRTERRRLHSPLTKEEMDELDENNIS